MNSHGNQTHKIVKFSLLLISCLFFRLLPFRAPNIEPITATLMPLAGAYGKFIATIFAILSVLLFDAITGTVGVHTLFTLSAFVTIAIWANSYFQTKKANTSNYVRFAIMSTLFFDAVTGLLTGPIFFDQPFLIALWGQLPFTALHLLGNIIFAATLSPAIYHILIRKRKLIPEPALLKNFNPKAV